jgi:three-Cys-motif partner protein
MSGLDRIGYWSEIKLDIVRKYASAYSTVLTKQPNIRSHVYIDAFAGAGVHIAKQTGEFVAGSPLNALNVKPPFKEFHLIDLDGGRVAQLRALAGNRNDVFVYEGDCNRILREKVFPRVRYQDFKRGLCLLDPYGLNLSWDVVYAAGQSKSIEIFINFMVMDVNMNVLKHDRSKVRSDQIARMNFFWGDQSWENASYSSSPGLFGAIESKSTNDSLVEAYRQRLKEVAGFAYVPAPIPMRNTSGAVVYYLFFASPNKTGASIVTDIFNTYRNRGS